MSAIPYADWSDYNLCLSDIVCKSTQMVVHKKSRDDWKIEQENDPIIGLVIEAIQTKTSNATGFSDESKRLFQNRSHLLFHCGLLYRKYLMANNKKINSSLFYPNPTGNNL